MRTFYNLYVRVSRNWVYLNTYDQLAEAQKEKARRTNARIFRVVQSDMGLQISSEEVI